MHMRNLFISVSFAVAALSAPVVAAGAQGGGDAPFLLGVATRALPDGERAVIVRTANGAQMDLILLAPDANAQHTLLGAVALLRDLRTRNPRPVTTDVASMSFAEARDEIPAERRGRLEAALRQAKNGEGRRLPQFGDVHVVVINPRSLR
jgi:hypothetical protein